MKKIINYIISLCICFLIIGISWAIEYYMLSTESYSKDSKVNSLFHILAINDKEKPISSENITILRVGYKSLNEIINEVKELHPSFTFAVPFGKHSVSLVDSNMPNIKLEILSESDNSGALISFDMYTEDYFFFNKYIVDKGQIYPVRFRMIGLGSGFPTLIIIFVNLVIYKILNRIFKFRDRISKALDASLEKRGRISTNK